MYHISSKKYLALAESLMEHFTDTSYFSGSVTLGGDGCGEARIRLTASLVIYRRAVKTFSAETDGIVDVVPVWWECRTSFGGREVCNDFDFSRLRELLIE